jgi:hypothetical protein
VTHAASLALLLGIPAQDIGVRAGVRVVARRAGNHVIAVIGGPVDIHQGKRLVSLPPDRGLNAHRVPKVLLAELELGRLRVTTETALRDRVQKGDRGDRLALLVHHDLELAGSIVGVVLVTGEALDLHGLRLLDLLDRALGILLAQSQRDLVVVAPNDVPPALGALA